jgi:hypothetical protein
MHEYTGDKTPAERDDATKGSAELLGVIDMEVTIVRSFNVLYFHRLWNMTILRTAALRKWRGKMRACMRGCALSYAHLVA